MGVAREHRVDTMSGGLCRVRVDHAGGPQVRHPGVAHLMGPDFHRGRLARRLPDVAVEVALAPQQARGGRPQQIGVDPSRGRLDDRQVPGRHGGQPTGVIGVVVGLGALRHDSLMGGAADGQQSPGVGVADEVTASQRQSLPEPQPAVAKAAHQTLVGAARGGEGVHLLKGPHPHLPAALGDADRWPGPSRR